MLETLISSESARTPARPFPWFCPKCGRKEVRRTTIPYQCQRLYHDRPVTISLASLSVPRCEHCGELVFDYEAEEQINRAYEALIRPNADAGSTAALGTESHSGNASTP